MPVAVLLIPVFASFAAPSGPLPAEPRILAVAEEIDRISARPLWPGFEPRKIPFEVLDGGRTWLARHPHPPAEFTALAGRADLRVFEGRHASLRANTSVEIAGIATATASFEGNGSGPRRLASLVLHEMFHVFQGLRHPRWGGNEVDLFLYPLDDPEALALRRLESDALRGSLAARGRAATEALAARALETRRERFARLPGPAVAYERGTEAKEGLARYIETLAAGPGEPLLPPEEFPAQAVRERAYASGCAIALLLDRLDPDWKERLERKDDVALDELLARAVAAVRPAPADAAKRDEERRRAARDIARLADRRLALRREFLETPGWTLVVEAEDPVFPQDFDPWNVERLSASEILHTRWLKLGNSSGSVEVLGRRCLTEASGRHPLFEGVRRMTVTGLPGEPLARETGQAVRVTADGVDLEFRGARLTRSGQTMVVTVGAKRPAEDRPGTAERPTGPR